jgi:DNA primase
MVQNGQSDKLNRLFHNPQPFIEFAIERIVKKYNLQNPLEKQQALEEGSAYLKTLPSSVANSYAGVLSGTLNINQNLVKVQTHQSNRLKQQKSTFEDTLELTIIKTLLTTPNLIDTLLDTIDVNMFKTHNAELSALLANDKDHPSLRRILLREDIKVYDEDELIASMLNFLYAFYTEELKKVKRSNMDYKNKSFTIRKMQDKIMKLRQGKLVNYER